METGTIVAIAIAAVVAVWLVALFFKMRSKRADQRREQAAADREAAEAERAHERASSRFRRADEIDPDRPTPSENGDSDRESERAGYER